MPTNASVPERMAARWLIGRAELGAGQTAAGRARLKALGDEAKRSGLVVMARRAARQ